MSFSSIVALISSMHLSLRITICTHARHLLQTGGSCNALTKQAATSKCAFSLKFLILWSHRGSRHRSLPFEQLPLPMCHHITRHDANMSTLSSFTCPRRNELEIAKEHKKCRSQVDLNPPCSHRTCCSPQLAPLAH